MAPVVRKLSSGPVDLESGYRVSWEAGLGETWSKSIQGNREALYDELQGLKDTHDRAELIPGKTPEDWVLTASVTDQSVRVDQFDLTAAQLQQSIYTSTRVLAAVGGVENMNAVRGAANAVRNAAGTDTANEAYDLAVDEIATAITDPTYQDNAYSLFDLLVKDTDTIANWSYYFTWTITLSRWDTDFSIDFTRVGQVFTRSQMLAFCGYSDNVANVPNIEWLLEGPSDSVTLGQRRVVTYRFIGADTWSSLLYDRTDGSGLDV